MGGESRASDANKFRHSQKIYKPWLTNDQAILPAFLLNLLKFLEQFFLWLELKNNISHYCISTFVKDKKDGRRGIIA